MTMKRGPHFSRLWYVPIDPLTRALRRMWFEPCRVADAGRPWEDCQ